MQASEAAIAGKINFIFNA